MRRFSCFSSLFAGIRPNSASTPSPTRSIIEVVVKSGSSASFNRAMTFLANADDSISSTWLSTAAASAPIPESTFSGGDARLSGIHQHDGRRLVARRYDSEHADDENHGRHRDRRNQPGAPTDDEPEASQAAYAAARNSDVSRRPLGETAGGIVIECRIASVVTNQHLWGLFSGRALPPRQSTFGRSNPILCDFNVNRRTRADALFTTHFWVCAAKG